ncbi:MAG: ABC transporter permease [Anaerolineae bacterium]
MTQAMSRPQVTFTDDQSLWYRIRWNISDVLTMTRRNLTYYIRQPELIVFSTIQPVMFVLLFAYVFGGAIATPNGNYIDFLLPGIIVQTVVFGATNTTIGLSDDLSKGMVDRFRSLPMARAAVLAGRTLADTIRNLWVILLMLLVGTLIGFRIHDGLLNATLAVVIAMLFGYAFTWISAFIALFVKSPEAVQTAGFIWVFPLVFASSVFVPPSTMPEWLQVFAENQPITRVANATRGLFLGGAQTADILWALFWVAVIVAIFVPLSIRQYRQIAR